MKKLSILFLIIGISFSAKGQTAKELKKELSTTKTAITKLDKKAKALQTKLNALPGWRKGAFGTIGGSLSGFNNWYARTAPTATAGSIGITVNAFANLIEEAFFWRNSAAVNLGWVKLDEQRVAGDEGFDTATDVFTISSLYGRRLNKTWAVSGLAEYRTTIIDNFNNPGYLDIGAGFTWTPKSDLVVVIHPGNYNFVFSDVDSVFESSLGAKIVADYTTNFKGISVKSNVSVFQSYEDSDLSNWTWTNSFGYTLYKGIGLGLEVGLRKNKQEALNSALRADPLASFNTINNKLQSYYLLGLSYAF
ncbi:MAG: hypothetical protein ACI8VJ_000981 [Polaribacter sp.]|jgi:hypothetical protein